MADRLALIIANSEFDDPKLTRLAMPSRDAEALADVLRDPNIGAFEVDVLLNQPLFDVRREIGRLFERRKRDDLLLFYYSGHGFRDDYGELYLAVSNTEKESFRATSLDAAFVRAQLDTSSSQRKVVLLDCCHSGAFAGGAKTVLGSSVGTEEAFKGRGYGRVILTASNAVEYAWEGDELLGEAEASVFTNFLVQGLRTGAADRDGDEKVSLDELYNYVFEQVTTSGFTKQTPQIWAHGVEGQVVIAYAPRPIVKPELLSELRLNLPKLKDEDWNHFLVEIKRGKVTPVLGPEIALGVLPPGSELTREWKKVLGHKQEGSEDVAQAAQLLAREHGYAFPKNEFAERWKSVAPPDFSASDEPYAVLADLPFLAYITTNHDDFLAQALEKRSKSPQRELCRWNKLIRNVPPMFIPADDFFPSPTAPLVFHLHGHHLVPESLVITEDDHLDFLVNVSRDHSLLPPRIRRSLAGTCLLLIGHSLEGSSLQAIKRGLGVFLERTLGYVPFLQLLPSDAPEFFGLDPERRETYEYLNQFLKEISLGPLAEAASRQMQKYLGERFSKGARVYWGTARELSAELRQRWDELDGGH